MQNTVDGGCGRIEASAVVDSTFCVADRHHEPYEGMLFESEDAARAYYDEYAGRTGFATRILSSRKSERDGSIISRGLGCRGIPDNHRSDTVLNEKGEKRRESCTAMIVVKRDKPGTWIVRKFVRDHNHPLVVSLSKKRPTFVSFMPSVNCQFRFSVLTIFVRFILLFLLLLVCVCLCVIFMFYPFSVL